MISLILASTLVFGDMNKTGAGKEFCEALNNYKGTTVILDSNGGIVKEAAIATQCIQGKDVIVKVLKSQSAATYMLHGMPWKCYHPKAALMTPFNSYVEISVEEARYYFGGVVCSVEGD